MNNPIINCPYCSRKLIAHYYNIKDNHYVDLNCHSSFLEENYFTCGQKVIFMIFQIIDNVYYSTYYSIPLLIDLSNFNFIPPDSFLFGSKDRKVTHILDKTYLKTIINTNFLQINFNINENIDLSFHIFNTLKRLKNLTPFL